MAKEKEYYEDNGMNGRQPEEIHMMPKVGWSDPEKKRFSEDMTMREQEVLCGMGAWRPPILQGAKKMWLFAILAGITSLFCEYIHTYMLTQVPFLRREYELDEKIVNILALPSPIASLFTVLFLSVIAKRVHIPKVLAITSIVAGCCALLCTVPFLHSKCDLTDAPHVLENKTYTVEKMLLEVPSCLLSRMPKEMLPKMMQIMAELEKDSGGGTPMGGGSPVVRKPAPVPKPAAATTEGSNDVNIPGTTVSSPLVVTGAPKVVTEAKTDPPTTTPGGSGVTIIMPNFEKLSKHPIYNSLLPMAKGMGIDLAAVQSMSVPEQAQYVLALPPNVQAMLPNLKAMLGPNPEQYFFSYELPKSRRKRNARVYADMMYSGGLAKMMEDRPPIPDWVQTKLFKELCPFNTEPFHKKDHSSMLLAIFVIAMICHGIAVAPRLALVVTFINDNTDEMETGKYLGMFTAIANLGALIAFVLGMGSMFTYITLEDTGYMTFLNPRWLSAWWLGLLIMGLLTCASSIPMRFFPRKMLRSVNYSLRHDSDCGSSFQEIKGLLSTLSRLMTNGVYVLIVIGSTLSYMAWGGVSSILLSYVSHQFSLEMMKPGAMLYCASAFLVLIGTFVGGFLSSKMKWSPLSCLKAAGILSAVLVVIHGANIGFGCEQPKLDKGLKIVRNISTTALCSKTCVCPDLSYAPVCGSDGVSYYSACHAGCADVKDGKFHDCKCLEDKERTVTPNMCDQKCYMYYFFCSAILIGALFVGIRLVPLLMSSYRCVEARDIPAAVGLKLFYIILFGNIVGPYIYSSLEGSTCDLRRPECGIMPTCAYYDIVGYRLRIFIFSILLEGVGLLMLLFAYLQGKKPSSKYNERVYDKAQIQ